MGYEGLKSVAVVMATYNGVEWVRQQLESILCQTGVNVTLYVSDDKSTDGTFEFLGEYSKADSRVRLLPQNKRYGSAGRNFYRLIIEVDFSCFDYVAFADQDDIWNSDKLINHITLIELSKATGLSSNVVAFWPNGRKELVFKSQPQKINDFLFESAGPGCTFMITPWLASEVRRQLLSNSAAYNVTMHDWLIYAVCRAHGKLWIIDSVPSVFYRQHMRNVIGANFGTKAAFIRFNKIKNGWYRREVSLISQVVSSINSSLKYKQFSKIVSSEKIIDQFRMIPFATQGRRKLSDRIILIITILFFVF